jgi:hypothetical protein
MLNSNCYFSLKNIEIGQPASLNGITIKVRRAKTNSSAIK